MREVGGAKLVLVIFFVLFLVWGTTAFSEEKKDSAPIVNNFSEAEKTKEVPTSRIIVDQQGVSKINADIIIKNDISDYVSILSAITALVAVIVGPVVSFVVVSKQFRLSSRHNFVSIFINDVCTYISKSKSYLEKNSKCLLKENESETLRVEISELFLKIQIMVKGFKCDAEVVDHCKSLHDIVNDAQGDYSIRIGSANKVCDSIMNSSSSVVAENNKC